MGRVGREVWAKRVARWRDSGLTAKEYAAETGLNANTLAHWSWRLRGKADAVGDEAIVEPEQPQVDEWVELTARPEDGPASAEPVARAVEQPAAVGSFEVVFTRGCTLRVPTDFDAVALRRLVDVLGDR